MLTDEQFDFYVNEVRQMRKELNDKVDNFIEELKGNINDVRTELKQEISNVRSELKAEVNNVRNELKSELALTRTELKAEIARGRKETMDLREDYLEEVARNAAQHVDIIKLMQSKVQELDERKVDKQLRTI